MPRISILILYLSFVAAFAASLIYVLRHFRTRKHFRLPPGPTGLPIVGNLYDFPKPGEVEAHFWAKHKALYGLTFVIYVSSYHKTF